MWADETDQHYHPGAVLTGIDALAYFLCETPLDSYPVEWTLGGGSKSYAFYNRPVLHHASGEVSPLSIVLAPAARLADDPPAFDAEALAGVFDRVGLRVAQFGDA